MRSKNAWALGAVAGDESIDEPRRARELLESGAALRVGTVVEVNGRGHA